MTDAVSMLKRPVSRRNLIHVEALALLFRTFDEERYRLPETVRMIHIIKVRKFVIHDIFEEIIRKQIQISV